MPALHAAKLRVFPERIVADWRRFAIGLWRLPKGDISDAYCADIFPRLRTFSQSGDIYANLGAAFSQSPVHAVVSAYPLMRAEESQRLAPMPYSYQGREGTFKGETFWLGPRVLFESSEPTTLEWRPILRAMYADCGRANQRSYAEFLATLSEKGDAMKMAVALELEHEISRFSKQEVSAFLERRPEQPHQMTLNL